MKADELIRLIKSYRAPGNIIDGVTLKLGVSSLNVVASEPSSRSVLPWLDLGNKNDRIIASSVEVMRQYPKRPVMLVTANISLQTKLSLATLPFVDPTG
jgi:predicted ribonuclease YlaK